MKIKIIYLFLICAISGLLLGGCGFFDQFSENTAEQTPEISMGEKIDAGGGFFKDEYKIYNPSKCLPDEQLNRLDAATFEVLNECFIKDKNNVYYRPYCGQDCGYTKHEKADAATLKKLKENFLQDKNHIYSARGSGDKIIAEADPYSFAPLEFEFAADKTNIYFENTIIASSGSSTHEIIDQNKIKIDDETYFCLSDMFGPRCRIYVPEEIADTTPETELNECEKAGGELSEKEECDGSKSSWCVISSKEECYADALIEGKCPIEAQSPKILCDNESGKKNETVNESEISGSCAYDSDCATTVFPTNSCCYGCPRPINKESVDILEKWRKNNCSNFDIKNECSKLDCSAPRKSICQNNKCRFEEEE